MSENNTSSDKLQDFQDLQVLQDLTVYEDYGDLFHPGALCNLQETARAGKAECSYLNNVYGNLCEHFNARRLF